MTSGFASAIAVAVFFSNFLLAALPISQKRRVSQGEPFRSFRILDEKLTLLADQQSSLKEALAADRVNSPTRSLASGSVKTILTQMNSTVGGIAHIANGLEHLTSVIDNPSRSERSEFCIAEQRQFSAKSGLCGHLCR